MRPARKVKRKKSPARSAERIDREWCRYNIDELIDRVQKIENKKYRISSFIRYSVRWGAVLVIAASFVMQTAVVAHFATKFW